MIRKNIQVTKEQDEQLKKESYKKDISQSEIIREALQKYFEEDNKMSKELLINMMVDALKTAEENYMKFVPEVNFEERESNWNKIKFVYKYWINEGLTTEIAAENFDDGIYFDDDISDFEYFLTKLTYGEAFGLSSKRSKEMLVENKVKNHIKPIREKIETL